MLDAARRRLRAEMGITAVDLVPASRFIYRVALAGGLIEHELDHVLVGEWSGDAAPDPAEVSEWRWVAPRELATDLAAHARRYSAWLPYVLRRAAAWRNIGGPRYSGVR